MNKYLKLLLLLPYLFLFHTQAKQVPAIQLASQYNLEHNISQYWISEKLDGVRGYWNGYQLFTKNGNPINAPQWFFKHWPKYPIDGELWIDRNKFEQVLSCVSKSTATPCWQNVKFMMFDLPKSTLNFTDRVEQMKQLVNQVKSPYLKVVHQFRLLTLADLDEKLADIVNQKGEGLMLHYEKAFYTVGKSQNIMKLKPYQEAQAIVLKHLKGKGKYKQMLGALQVKTTEGIIFKIGTGFSDNDRRNPPAIGSIITFKYIGKTQRGVPKFASFLHAKQF